MLTQPARLAVVALAAQRLGELALSRRHEGRWLNHPNYVAVAAEIAAFPLIFRAPRTALVFSMANAVLMRTRIRAENAALRAAGSPAQPLRPRVSVV